MSETYEHIRISLQEAVEQNNEGQAKQLADQLIEQEPDDIYSFVTLAYYYHYVDEDDDTLHWIDQTLEKDPEDEAVLEILIGLLEGLYEPNKVRVVVSIGLKLYPENALFHAQHAELQRDEHPEQAKVSLLEALRLEPENAYYLGSYGLLLYQMEERDEAATYERLALQHNPTNGWMFLQFAWVAYQLKNFKKAQYLIDEAIQLDPHNEAIQDMYKTIYPTKNGFVRATLESSFVVGKFIGYPATFLWKATNEKLSHRTIFIFVFLLEMIFLHVLLGKYLYMFLGLFIGFVYIGNKVRKSIVANYTLAEPSDEAIHPQFKDHLISMAEVEDRFHSLTDPNVKPTVPAPIPDAKWLDVEWPTEYSRWARVATALLFIIAIILRFATDL